MPRTLVITRNWKKSTYTVGRFYVDGALWCNTMEDRDRDLYSAMPEAVIKSKKVYGETAIPRGQYIVEPTYSPKFAKTAWGSKYGGIVPEIKGVKGWSGVRIHPLNTATDSLGCIGIGENSAKGMILKSTQWYYRLMDEVIMPAYKVGEAITLDIQ